MTAEPIQVPPPLIVGDADIIPPPTANKPRTLVLCFDGTGDQFDSDNSNVIQFFTLLQKDDHNQQLVYYQAGIGTWTSPQVATPFWTSVSKALDEAVAWDLAAHIMDGYTFLMENYQLGDKICLFGFSRGAYTARCLAGMVQKVGLLPASNHRQVPFAYKMYTRTDDVGWKQSVAFKKAFSIDVDVEFVGVWDTVCSVGLISRRLPFVSSNTSIRYFRHALSLDEHRAKFKANHWNRPDEDEAQLGTKLGDMPKSASTTTTTTTGKGVNGLKGKSAIYDGATLINDSLKKYATYNYAQEEEDEQSRQESVFVTESGGLKMGGAGAAGAMDGVGEDTDVLEVWFSGCHCDVGGGSVANNTRHNLARIPLRWMIRQCFLANTGIRFHASLFKTVGLDIDNLYPIVKPRPAAITDLSSIPLPISPSSSSSSDPSAEPIKTTSITGLTQTQHDRSATDATLINPETAPPLEPFISEEVEDLLDSRCLVYDQLKISWWWWILEVIPFSYRMQEPPSNKWTEKLLINLGRARDIPTPTKITPFNVHRSVQIRMGAEELKGGKYVPLPFGKIKDTPNWVA